VNRRTLLTLLLPLASACGDSGPGGSGLDAYVGTWTIEVDAATNCWSAFSIGLTVSQADVDAGVNGTANLTDFWALTSTPGDLRPYQGHITDGGNADDFAFLLRVSTTSAVGLSFTGSDPSPSRMSGTLTDAEGLIAGHACTSNANATKD
jgi:hypothetical protein